MVAEIGITLLGIFFLLVLCNVPIAVSLGASSIVTMLLFGMPINAYADTVLAGMQKFTLLAIPFFILSGVIMEKSGISRELVDFINLLIGDIPGGLVIVSIVVTLFWGAISGSGPATVAALGGILIPAMVHQGYDSAFAAASVAAPGGISVVIPPSIPFVIYGVLANVSIGTLFMAGIIPGIMMGGCLIVWAVIVSVKNHWRGVPRKSGKELWHAFKRAIWGLLAPVIILGGIYGGIFTPTEAAVVSVFYSLIVGVFVYKTVRLRDLAEMFADTAVSSGSLMLIIANANFLSYLITVSGVGTAVSASILGASTSPVVVILLCALILFIAGFFLDGGSILYIFVPILLPVVKQIGYDPIWFGVMAAMCCSVGMSTPPVAVNLYPAARIGGVSLLAISKSVIGYVIFSIIAVILVILFPDIVLFVPRLLGYSPM